MTARRPVLALTTAAVCALALAGPALAASPQQIYKDLADNGRLDRQYSEADIARAFSLERVIGTDQPTAGPRRAQQLGPRRAPSSSRKIPFSGLDVALLIVGGVPLLLIGLGLRRRVAQSTPRAEAVRS